MSAARVHQAIEILEAQGQAPSAKNVLRVMRSTPPYLGMSYRDLLPLLKIHTLPTEAEQAEQDLLAMAERCEEAITHQASDGARQKLITDSESLWIRCAAVRNRGSARGEDLTALVAAFERLRHAMSTLICASGQARPNKIIGKKWSGGV